VLAIFCQKMPQLDFLLFLDEIAWISLFIYLMYINIVVLQIFQLVRGFIDVMSSKKCLADTKMSQLVIKE